MNRLLAAACLALGLIVPAFAEDDKKDKDKPNPAATKSDLSKHGRHKLFLKRVADTKGKGQVIFLGDSITEGWEGGGGRAAWDNHFWAFDPVNLGISGDRTGGVLWRITDGKEIAELKPKAAVIMIGTNNLSGGHTPEQIAGGIKAIVEELQSQKPGIKILLLAVFPRGNRSDADKETKTIPAAKLNPGIGKINELIAKFDDGKTVFYKDIGKVFLDKEGGLPAETMPDYLHLSGKGYDLWGKAIKADLVKLTGITPDESKKPNPAVTKLNRDIPRHKEFLKRIADSKGKGEVIFLGDSITHGWEGNQKAWKAHFGAFDPVNLGIGGDQTGHVLWRITDGKELDDLKPKAAVIMIGTNNMGAHSAEQIAGGVKAIVEELKKQKPGIKILVLAIFPRTTAFNKSKDPKLATPEELMTKVKATNDILAKLDDGKQVFYKDIGKEFLDKEGNLPKDIMYDYLHLTGKGYDIWGKAIKADLEKLTK